MDANGLLSRLPVLRLLIPLIAGIILYDFCQSLWVAAVPAILSLTILCFFFFVKDSPLSRLQLKQYRYVPLFLAMIAVGWMAAWLKAPPSINLDRVNGTIAYARIETIDYNEKSMSMQLQLLNDSDDNKFDGSHILLSTRGCDYDLQAADIIAFKLNLEKVRNLGNPDEMDYARSLYHKGIIYRQHIKVDDIEKVGRSLTITTFAFNLRQDLQHKIMASHMLPETQELMIAMLLGNDDFISSDTRDNFSKAGVAHVLALSGLHLSIITFLIWFLLFPLDYIKGKKLRLVLTLLLLIVYDVLTGLSPSVIRATVMLAFVFLSAIFFRKSSPLNSLFAAALVILVFSPFSLFGVGFQLSFITVASLIIFYKLFQIKGIKNRILNYVYTILVTSIVAMLSTIILTAYYFNTISFMSLLSNIIILPICPVFMIMGACGVVFLATGVDVVVVDRVLDFLANIVTGSVGIFAKVPYVSGSVYVTWWAVAVYYVILVVVVLWIYRKNIRYLFIAGAAICIGIAHSVIFDFNISRKGLVVFNSYNSTPVLFFNQAEALLWVPDVESDFDLQSFKRQHLAFLAHHRIDSITLVDTALHKLADGAVMHPYAKLQGKGFISIGKGRWKHYTRNEDNTIKFDFALITKRYHSTIAVLDNLIDCNTVMLSGDIYQDDLPNLEKECRDLRKPYYSLKSQGAYVMME